MGVLVTGGAGYIGSHMVLGLRDRGERVVVLDDLSTGFAAAVPEGVELVVGDVADEALVESTMRTHGLTRLAHFAASIVVPDSVADPLGYYWNNTARTIALARGAVRAGLTAMVFSSTAAVYGTPAGEIVEEDSPVHPESPYGASKLMSERVLRDAAAAHGFGLGILRYFNVAGADPAGRAGQSFRNATHLIKVCVQCALGRRGPVQIMGTDYPTPDGSGVRDYIHVSDLIEAHLLMLDRIGPGRPPSLVNCAYGRGYSVLEVIAAVKRVSGVDFPVITAPRRPGDPARIVASGAAARQTLGWKPRFDDLDRIVADALAWERHLPPET